MPFFRRREVREVPAPATPASREDVGRRLQEAAPGAGARLADELRPAVRLAARREPDAAMDIGATKFGGAPDLPHGTRWPMWTPPGSAEARPLQFFAQVNLAEVAAVAPGPLDLPPEGQLSFFADFGVDGQSVTGLDLAQHGGSTVLYSPPLAQFVRCSPRIAPLSSGEFRPMGRWTWPRHLPGGAPIPDADARALDQVDAELEADLRAAVPEGWFLVGGHQFGGHGRCGGDWRLLLQLGSDDVLEIVWPGRGTLAWTVRPDDVTAAHWDAGRFELVS